MFSLAGATSPGHAEVLDFELPQIDGARFVRLSALRGQPAVINVWASDCPPCVRELPLLSAWAARTSGVAFIGIATSPRADTQAFLAAHPQRLMQLTAGVDARAVLRRLGNASGALPYTLVLRADHSHCRAKTGEIDAAWLQQSLALCGKPP